MKEIRRIKKQSDTERFFNSTRRTVRRSVRTISRGLNWLNAKSAEYQAREQARQALQGRRGRAVVGIDWDRIK